jgi:hypothetical protein
MLVDQYVTERLVGKFLLAWFLALVLAGIGTLYTSFSIVEIAGVIGMLGTLGILSIQVHEASRSKEETLEPEKQESPSGSLDDEDVESSATEKQVGTTAGLSATERRVQNELLREAYHRFTARPFTFWPTSRGEMLRSYLQDTFEDVDEEVVDKVWRFSKDDGFFKRRPGKQSLTITPKALWRAEELGEDLLLDDTVQEEILDVLLQSYQADPTYPRIDRDELIEALGRAPDVVDQNLWLLREKGYVDTQAYMNASDTGYSEVKITQLGRQVSQ